MAIFMRGIFILDGHLLEGATYSFRVNMASDIAVSARNLYSIIELLQAWFAPDLFGDMLPVPEPLELQASPCGC